MDWVFRLISSYNRFDHLACAFGLVLYRDADLYVKRVVYSNDCCRALNEISGDRWLLLASRLRNHGGERRSFDVLRVEFRGGMSQEWAESEDRIRLLDAIGLQSLDDLPCLAMFFADVNDEIIVDHYPLLGKSENEAYEYLKSMVRAITEAIEGVSAENLKNAAGVRGAVALRLQAEQDRRQLRAVGRRLSSAIPFIKWLFALPGSH